jgi:hypothetical protein
MFEENQQPAIQTKIAQPFGGFFQQIKVRQPIGRKYSLQTMIPTSRRLDSFLYEAAFQIFKTEIKKSKTLCSRCLVKAFPLLVGTTLMQIQSGRTVPLIGHFYLS